MKSAVQDREQGVAPIAILSIQRLKIWKMQGMKIMNWLKRANHEILDLLSQTTAITDVRNIKNPDSTHQSTAITAERNLTSVLAVPNLNKSKISTFSNVSNGSGLTKKNQNFNVSCKEEK